ncbi:12105_t:CDS:2, partial [Funneliformis geosporum]
KDLQQRAKMEDNEAQLAEQLLKSGWNSEAIVSTYVDGVESMSKVRKTILNDIDATTSTSATAPKRSLQNDLKALPQRTKIDYCTLVTSPQREQAQPPCTPPHQIYSSDVSSDFVSENDSEEHVQESLGSENNHISESSDELLEVL